MILVRKTFDELNQLKKELGVDKLWSFSAVDQFKTSKYVYYLKYIAHVPTNLPPNIYGKMGGFVHDCLEKLYLGKEKISREDLYKDFEAYWAVNIDMLDIKFNRTDEKINNSAKTKYHDCLINFMKTHELIEDKIMLLEQFILAHVGDYYFQGYADAIAFDENEGTFTIIDWKTSSKYSNRDIPSKGRQLLLYALSLHQLGIPLSKIRACWNFMKYVSVDCMQKNGKVKVRYIERSLIGEKLLKSVNGWLKTFGYSEDEIMKYDEYLLQLNSLDSLPEEVQEKYSIHDCYVYVDVNEESLDNLKQDLLNTINNIKELEEKYRSTNDDTVFWDDEESLKQQEYWYYNICDYSIDTVLPFKQYVEEKERNKGGVDLLAEMGVSPDTSSSDIEDAINNNAVLRSLFG